MTTRRVTKTVRHSGGGVNVVADLNAVVSTGGAASSRTTTTVTQTATRRRARGDDGPTTRGDR